MAEGSSAASPALPFRQHFGVGGLRLVQAPAGISFLLALLLFGYIQFAGPNMVDYDGYYHIKMAWLIRHEGLPTRFPWLPLTVLDEKNYTDHHTLFHVMQVPFTYLSDLRIAAKASAVFFAALAFGAVIWVLQQYRVPYPLFWLVLLFASSAPFLYRMSMPRAPSLALTFQLLAFHFILQRRYLPLFIVSTLFVWAYNGFPTLMMLAGTGLVAFLVVDRKVEYRLAASICGGILAGLIINPYFPQNIFFLHDHIVPKIFFTNYATRVGSEWYPYDSWIMLLFSLGACLSYLLAVAITNRREWLRDKPRLFSFLVATFYLFMLFKSRRFVEYFPPFAVLFLALTAREHLREIRLTKTLVLPALLVVALLAVRSVHHVRADVRNEPDTLACKGAAEWLAANTPEGSIVFHTDWDDFPMLFFYNTHNRYIVGLDADNLRLKDEKLFRLWENITLGRVADPADAIVSTFRSRYVFTDRAHEEFIAIADAHPRFSRKYTSRETIVYTIE